MTHLEIEQFANDLIAKHLDRVWHFKWTNEKTTWGTCDEGDWSIALSKLLFDVLIDKTNAKKTIIHEVAHALAGCKEGHNEKWKKAVRFLGDPNPSRLASYPIDDQNHYKYVIILRNGDDFEPTSYRGFHRLPRKSMKRTFVKGKKEQTLGKLFYARQEDWNKWLWDEISTTELVKEVWQ